MRGAAEILDLELLWAQTRGDPGICIAVLDGPVDEEHPCFRGAHLTHLPTTADPACGGGAASSHGTHVASIIFGQHDGTVRGVAPGCAGLMRRSSPTRAVSRPAPSSTSPARSC